METKGKVRPADYKKLLDFYGRKAAYTCGRCCNCQPIAWNAKTKFCAAFGRKEGVRWEWDEKLTACGLFNFAFAALRPKRVPLIDVLYQNPAAGAESEQMTMQLPL